MPLTLENVKTLVEWLGVDGVAAGLERGSVTVAELHSLLTAQGISMPSKIRKSELIAELLSGYQRKIDKSVDELLRMDTQSLVAYFEEVRPSRKELLAILGELNFQPGAEDQKSLYKYAARQIGETGMFQRVARGPSR
jgi:hypothetical protein